MATTRYHRWVVMASVIRLLTSSTPTLLAAAGPDQAGERSQPRRPGRGHHLHDRADRDPGPRHITVPGVGYVSAALPAPLGSAGPPLGLPGAQPPAVQHPVAQQPG